MLNTKKRLTYISEMPEYYFETSSVLAKLVVSKGKDMLIESVEHKQTVIYCRKLFGKV